MRQRRSPEIIYAEVMLTRWGRWSARNADVGLGHRKESTVGRVMRLGAQGALVRGGPWNSDHIEIPEDVELADRLVKRLPMLYQDILVARYLFGWTNDAILVKLELSRRKYRRHRIEAIERFVRMLAEDPA